MNEINMKSNKAEIVSAALEAIDYHTAENVRLKQQQKALFIVSGVMLLMLTF